MTSAGGASLNLPHFRYRPSVTPCIAELNHEEIVVERIVLRQGDVRGGCRRFTVRAAAAEGTMKYAANISDAVLAACC